MIFECKYTFHSLLNLSFLISYQIICTTFSSHSSLSNVYLTVKKASSLSLFSWRPARALSYIQLTRDSQDCSRSKLNFSMKMHISYDTLITQKVQKFTL